MEITQIRNATVLITYADVKFLVDPMLGPKGCMKPFPFSKRQDQRNPLNDLPFQKEKVLEGVDAVILTHLHEDHVDETAYEVIPKTMKIFVQDDKDKGIVERKGFKDVEILSESTTFKGVKLIKTPGQHGHFPMRLAAGHTCGVVFEGNGEKILYLVGDTIWFKGVSQTIAKYRPEIILVNGGGNKFHIGGPVIMATKDILKVHEAAPEAMIISSHMEGVNHWSVSRKELADFAKTHKFSDKLLIPLDGETIIEL